MEKTEAEQIEYETVQVRVPKAVMDLLRTFKKEDLEDYLTSVIVESVGSALDADFHLGGGEIISYWQIVESFKLKPVFETFEVPMPVKRDC